MVIVVRQREDDESPSSGSRCDVGQPSLVSAAFRRAPWEADITRGWVRLGRHVTVCKSTPQRFRDVGNGHGQPTKLRVTPAGGVRAAALDGPTTGQGYGDGASLRVRKVGFRLRVAHPTSQAQVSDRLVPTNPSELRAQHRVIELIFLSYTLVPLDSPCPPPASPLPRCVR